MTKLRTAHTLWQRTILVLSAFVIASAAQAATIRWIGAAGDGNWSTPTNWDLFRAPVTNDDVVINDFAHTTLVTVATTITIRSLTSDEALRITGNLTVSSSVNLTKDVNIDGGSFTLSQGGTLSTLSIINNGTLTIGFSRSVSVSGLFTWNRGTISGGSSIFSANGGGSYGATATGQRQTQGGLDLLLGGTHTWSGNNFSFSSSTTVSLNSGATLNISNSQGSWNGGAFNNNGTINRLTGTGTITIACAFKNSNRLDVNTGAILLNNTGSQLATHTGQFNVASTRTLRFVGNHQISTGSIQGAGQVILDSGTLLVSNTYNITGGTQVFGGLLQFSSSSTITNMGGLSVSNGEVVFNRNPSTIGPITISGGEINFNNFSRSFATINMTGGTITGNGNVITIAANSTMSGGSFSGNGELIINSGVTLTINGSANKSISGRSITNNGTISWSGTGNLTTQFQLNNNGTINAASSGSTNQGEWSGGIIWNLNIFNANDGRNVIRNLFLNHSLCNLPAGGDLQLLGGGSHSNGSRFRLTSTGTTGTTAAALTFDGGHTFSSNSGITNMSGPSTVEFRGGSNTLGVYDMHTTIVSGANTVVNFNNNANLGNVTLFGDATIAGTGNLTANQMLWQKGRIAGSGTFNVASITWNIQMNGNNPVDSGEKRIQGTRSVNVSGVLSWIDGLALLEAGASLNILAGGSLNVLFNTAHSISGGTVSVSGTLQHTNTAPLLTINSTFNTTNTGVVQLGSSNLAHNGSGTHSGRFNIASGRGFVLNLGTHTFNANARTEGAGDVLLNSGTASVTGQFTHTGKTTIVQGSTLNFNANQTLAGELHVIGTQGGSGTVNCNGILRWSGGTLRGTGTTVAHNQILFTATPCQIQDTRVLENRGTFNIATPLQIQGTGTLRNIGTMNVTANSPSTISTLWVNEGSLIVQNNTLQFTNEARQTAGFTRATSVIEFQQPYLIEGGNIIGTGRFIGNIQMQGGTVSPGTSPGTLIVEGRLTWGNDTHYFVEITGTNAANIDKVRVIGNAPLGIAHLSGVVEVLFDNGHVPQLGDRYRVLEYREKTGQFASLTLPELPAGLWIVPEYDATGMDLVVVLDRIPGDVDGDGCVNDEDLLAVLFAFGQSGGSLPPDLNDDGTVNDEDLLLVLFNFGNGC
ncbi:MAG: hypothetical protein KIT45_14235 [Fimbriimonadia bacterium]|nr:hypothetical protein [Fimbriimonadia bacterium]